LPVAWTSRFSGACCFPSRHHRRYRRVVLTLVPVVGLQVMDPP
jgi:hypothetical protein